MIQLGCKFKNKNIMNKSMSCESKYVPGLKKIFLLVIVFLVATTFSGCKKDKNKEVGSSPDQESKEDSSGENAGAGEGGIISAVKDILSSQKKLECTYAANGGDDINVETKTYVYKDKYKTEFAINGKKNISVFDGNVSYSWEEGNNQGMKIDLKCLEDFNSVAGDEYSEASGDAEEMDDLEELLNGAQGVKCKEVGSIDFSIPQDVDFADQCELLKKQQKMIEDMNVENVPEGFPEF